MSCACTGEQKLRGPSARGQCRGLCPVCVMCNKKRRTSLHTEAARVNRVSPSCPRAVHALRVKRDMHDMCLADRPEHGRRFSFPSCPRVHASIEARSIDRQRNRRPRHARMSDAEEGDAESHRDSSSDDSPTRRIRDRASPPRLPEDYTERLYIYKSLCAPACTRVYAEEECARAPAP